MLNHGRNGAALMNRNNDISSDHTLWIKEQINKGTFVSIHGREVWIKVPGRNLSRIVNVPERGSALYRKAWIDVYNYCLDFLEGSINAACLENKFIQRMGDVWTLNGHVIRWPKFNEMSSSYARGLEDILREYSYVKRRYILSVKKNSGIEVKKTSVSLKNVSSQQTRLKVVPKLQYDEPKKVDVVKRVPVKKEPIKVETITEEEPRKIKPSISRRSVRIPKTNRSTEVPVSFSDSLVIQKISDGDLIGNRDIENFRKSKTDIVVLTCMDVLNPKDEDLFIKNARKCHKEGIVTGAFIYGKATDEHEAAGELKIMLKILSKCEDDFSGLFYYSINNDFVRKNKKKEEKLLEFINMFNAVVSTLKQSGYTALLSMSLESGKILSNICRKHNIQIEHDISYMVVVRDTDEVSENSSKIVVDPWNDYDVVTIRNERIKNSIKKA